MIGAARERKVTGDGPTSTSITDAAFTFNDPAMNPSSPSSRASKFLTIASAIGLACVSIPAMANALDDLHAFAAQTKTARGDFTQRVVSRTQRAAQPTSGEFVFARPGRFRWSYTKPYEQLLVADGTKLSIYDKDLNQVTVRKLGDALGSTPAAILFGSSDLDQNFALKDAGTHDGIAWLEASPKTRDTAFETIRIGFRDGELAAMELKDALGQTTMLEFSHVQRNPKIDASTFEFVPPKGADVLQN
jgi:outer membrane lipoprotein carrier protein